MRALIIALLLMPLSGCIGGVGLLETDLFDYIEVERGDPTPIAMDSCGELLTSLNVRAEQQALVSLHQSYEGVGHFGFRGDVAVAESASEDSSGAAAPEAASDGANFNDAEVTGTNNQEANVDEADILKTDGTWTYTVQGSYLYIMHSTSVGNLSLHSTVKLPGGWASQLLLVDGGDGPDRLVVIMNGIQGPEPVDQGKPDSDSGDRIAESSIMYDPYYGGSYSRIQVYDLSDRKSPAVLDDHYIQGNNVGARLVDGVVHVVVHQYAPYLNLQTWAGPNEEILQDEGLTWDQYWDLPNQRQQEIILKSVEQAIESNKKILDDATLESHLPAIYSLGGDGNFSRQAYTESQCANIVATPDEMSRAVNTIFSMDVAGELEYNTKQIFSGYPILYGAEDALVLASSSQEFWWFWAQPDLDEATNLHWFDLDGLDVTHRASGRTDGIVQDQFGIDVHDGQLRVATTTGTWGRWWLEDPEPMQNHLVVFQEVAGALVETGSVTGFAEEERIWSARFTDDRAYIVTFQQIDPLWIIDLSDPTNPTILGELEIPGVSTYIHPLEGGNQLLTIGLGPGPDNQGLDWSRIQVSLFDISDPQNPVRSDVYDVTLPGDQKDGWSWGYSAALHEHKAFTYWEKLGMLSIPVSWQHYQETCSSEGGKRTCTTVQEFNAGIRLIDVDRDAGTLTEYGSVDQDVLMPEDENRFYWGTEVERSYFLGFPDQFPDQPVSVYALSNLGMTAHDLATLADQDYVAFQNPYDHYGSETEPASQPLLEDAIVLA